MKPYFLLILAFCGAIQLSYAQGISGLVTSETNEPIPFVNIYIKTLERGTTTDAAGQYYLTIQPGEYEVIFSALGYQTQSKEVKVEDGEVILNVQLLEDNIELNEVVIKASKKNPANEIIRKVIANKDKYLKDATSFRCQVYIKATELIEEKRKKGTDKPKESIVSLEGAAIDPFESANNQKENEIDKINLAEIQLTLNFQAPDAYKEERTAYKSYGDISGLYLPRFDENDFNIYRNLLPLNGISETPVISPLSRTAILSL